MSEQEIKVGVVGVGHMGRLHLQKLLTVTTAQVVGVVDPHPEKREALQRDFPVPVLTGLSELLFEADAVVIASPTPTHYRIAKQALEAGVDVLLEKPATDSLPELEELCQLAEARKQVLQVGLLERYRLESFRPLPSPRFLSVRRYTDRVGREPNVDVVNDLMIHDLDLVLSVFGEEPTEIEAVGWRTISPTPDTVHAWLRFPSGRTAMVGASRVSPIRERRIDWCSTEGQHVLDLQNNSFDALGAQARDFLENVRLRKPAMVDGRASLRCQKLVTQVLSNLESRAGLPLSYLDQRHEI